MANFALVPQLAAPFDKFVWDGSDEIVPGSLQSAEIQQVRAETVRYFKTAVAKGRRGASLLDANILGTASLLDIDVGSNAGFAISPGWATWKDQ